MEGDTSMLRIKTIEIVEFYRLVHILKLAEQTTTSNVITGS